MLRNANIVCLFVCLPACIKSAPCAVSNRTFYFFTRDSQVAERGKRKREKEETRAYFSCRPRRRGLCAPGSRSYTARRRPAAPRPPAGCGPSPLASACGRRSLFGRRPSPTRTSAAPPRRWGGNDNMKENASLRSPSTGRRAEVELRNSHGPLEFVVLDGRVQRLQTNA